MGMYRPTKEEIIIDDYKKRGIKEALNLAIKEYKLRTVDEINEILIKIAEISKIKDLKVEEFQTYIEKAIYYADLIERTENKYGKMELMESIDQAYYEIWEEELKNRINKIANKFNKLKNDSINSMSVSEFVEYIFDKNNWFKYNKIVYLLTQYCLNNNLKSNLDEQILAIINTILKDNDSLETTILTSEMETHLKNKIKANEQIVENYLKCLIKDRDEQIKLEAEQKEKCEFINSIIDCYLSKGLREALINLHANSNDFKEDFILFLKEIYRMHNIKFKAEDIIFNLIKNLENTKSTVKEIFYQNKGYKGELPQSAKDDLKDNNAIYNHNLDELVKIINKDFNEKQLYHNDCLPLKEFINIIINKTAIPAKEEIYSEIIKYCELRGFTIAFTDTLDNFLEEIIRIKKIKNETEVESPGPFDLSDDYLKIAIDKLVDYIKTATNQTIFDEEEKAYYEVKELTQKNKKLYSQIESLHKQIELNEDKKVELTLKYQNIILRK